MALGDLCQHLRSFDLVHRHQSQVLVEISREKHARTEQIARWTSIPAGNVPKMRLVKFKKKQAEEKAHSQNEQCVQQRQQFDYIRVGPRTLATIISRH